MAILVTGGTGFIGLNLIEALLAREEEVICLSTEDIHPVFLEAVSDRSKNIRCVVGDVCDPSLLNSVFRTHKITGMFPLAAITAGSRREAIEPERLFSVNVDGLILQLRAARDAGVGRIVVPASGAIYGDSYFDRAVVDEATTACEPRDLYGITKFAAERVSLRLAQLWKLDLVVARIGGTFGPWERPTGVRDLITPFYHIAQMAKRGEDIILPYDIPDYCWVYSRDIASGLVHMFYEAQSGLVANISSGMNWGSMILIFVEELRKIYPALSWHQSSDAKEINVPFTDSRSRARMNINRILNSGWKPNYLPHAAISDYVKWLSQYAEAVIS